MFYVSGEAFGSLYEVTDTADGVTEKYRKETVLKAAKEVYISGVAGDNIFIVKKPNIIMSLIKDRRFTDAVEKMPNHVTFTLSIKSKPNGLGIVNHASIGVYRTDIDSYTICDDGRGGKGIHTGLTAEQTISMLRSFWVSPDILDLECCKYSIGA